MFDIRIQLLIVVQTVVSFGWTRTNCEVP